MTGQSLTNGGHGCQRRFREGMIWRKENRRKENGEGRLLFRSQSSDRIDVSCAASGKKAGEQRSSGEHYARGD